LRIFLSTELERKFCARQIIQGIKAFMRQNYRRICPIEDKTAEGTKLVLEKWMLGY